MRRYLQFSIPTLFVLTALTAVTFMIVPPVVAMMAKVTDRLWNFAVLYNVVIACGKLGAGVTSGTAAFVAAHNGGIDWVSPPARLLI